MNILLLTNEYPPNIYGGAGVHADHLSRALAGLDERRHRLHVLCFGNQKKDEDNIRVDGVCEPIESAFHDSRHKKLLEALYRNVMMIGLVKGPDIIHCHTWYTYLAGCLIKQVFGVPMVLTTHSLEPQRPWKEEQLGSGYRATAWLEKTTCENADGVIAVSRSMKSAVRELYGVPSRKIRVIPNGIDTDQYRPTFDPELLASYRINPDQPFVLFVGRITRQKGILHLIRAIPYLMPGTQVVLCAGAPDTEEMGREVAEGVKTAQTETAHPVVWIDGWVSQSHLIRFLSHASVLACPSIYEPFGIVNLEAMACGTPVVASSVGGIPEVVVPGKTGWLVPLESKGGLSPEPRDPEQFSKNLAAALNRLLLSPKERQRMGLLSRKRVKKLFSWESVALKTLAFYRELVKP